MNNVYIHQVHNNSSEYVHLLYFNDQDSLSFDILLAPNEMCDYKKIHDRNNNLVAEIPKINSESEFSSKHLHIRVGKKIHAIYEYKNKICHSSQGSFIENAPMLKNYTNQNAIKLIIDETGNLSAQTMTFIDKSNLISIAWFSRRYALYGLNENSIMEKGYYTDNWAPWAYYDQPTIDGFKDAISATTWRASIYGIFLLGNDDYIYQRIFNMVEWKNWTKHAPPQGVTLLGFDTVSWFVDRYGIYAVGNDGQLYERYFNDGWHKWKSLKSPKNVKLSGSITAVSWVNSRYGIYVLGEDGNIWEKWFATIHWSDWTKQKQPLSKLKSITSCNWVASSYFLAGIGEDGNLHFRHYRSVTGWEDWRNLGHPPATKLKGKITAVSPIETEFLIFAEGEDNLIYSYDDGKWNILDGK